MTRRALIEHDEHACRHERLNNEMLAAALLATDDDCDCTPVVFTRRPGEPLTRDLAASDIRCFIEHHELCISGEHLESIDYRMTITLEGNVN